MKPTIYSTKNCRKTILVWAAVNTARYEFTVSYDKWFQTQVNVGSANANVWQVESGFDWTQLKKVRVVCWFDSAGTGPVSGWTAYFLVVAVTARCKKTQAVKAVMG